MTIVTKLELQGFKSFAKKTELLLGNNFNCVLGANGSGKSARGDTEVLLSTGEIKTIAELVNTALKKAKHTQKLDDGIYTTENSKKLSVLGLENFKVVEKPISAFMKRDGEPHLYEIKTYSGKKAVTTGCHPVMIYKEGKVKSEVVKKLKKNQLIATPRTLKLTPKTLNVEGYRINASLARLLGYLIGDGYVRQDRIEIINADQEIITDFKFLLKEIFNTKPKYEKKTGNATRIICWDKKVTKLLYRLFRPKNNPPSITSLYKAIPMEFMVSDDNVARSLLAALFDCDGTVSRSLPFMEFTNKNEKLIGQMQLLLLRFGIISIKKEKYKAATNTKNKTKRKYFNLIVYGKDNLGLMYDNISLKCQHKRERLAIWAKRDVKSNPNLDILPKEVNKLVRQCKESLLIGYKPLKKMYPKLSAYLGNRCNPSRQGINEILQLFNEKLELLRYSRKNLKLEQKALIRILNQIRIPGAVASRAIGLKRNMVRDFWEKELFNARPRNLKKFYEFMKLELDYRIKDAELIMKKLAAIANSDIYWDRITQIKKVKGEEYVYDLTIPNCHNFIGNGIFVHNSNIVDAISFVLGKISAKGMRAEKSANLIYNGGKKGSPAKFAEVSISFDNSKKEFPIGGKEVKITRTVKQNGQSTYRINREVRTRQQVIDILRKAKIDPDGHNIILQGDIVHFTEMKTEERREIVEEIAGISVFEEKKAKAMSELNKVQDKLNEANIILTERDKTMRELKTDRDQALQYKDIESMIKRSKATRLNFMIRQKDEVVKDHELRLNKAQEEIDAQQKKIDESRKKIEECNKQIADIKQQLDEKGDEKQKEISNEIDELKTSIVKTSSRIDVVKGELRKIAENSKQLSEGIKDAEQQIARLTAEKQGFETESSEMIKKIEVAENRIAAIKGKFGVSGIGELSQKIDEIDSIIERKQKHLEEAKEKLSSLLLRKGQVELKLKEHDSELRKLEDLKKEDREKLERLKLLKKEFGEVAKKLSFALNEDSMYAAQLGEKREKLDELNEELTKLKAKEMSMKVFSAQHKAIDFILSSKISGVLGTVAQLGKVGSKYSQALEVAAGSRIMGIVVSTDAVAANCISLLKEKKLGVVTFLPINKMKERVIDQQSKEVSNIPGTHGFALGLVRFDSRLKNVFSYVFGPTVVVDDVATARKIGIGRARMVTLDGDLIEASGAMVGGYRYKSSFKFKEEGMESSIEGYGGQAAKLCAVISDLETKRKANEEGIMRLRERKAVLESQITELQEKCGIVKGVEDAMAGRKDALAEAATVESEKKGCEDDIQALKSELASTMEERSEMKSVISNMSSVKVATELEKEEGARQKLIEKKHALDSDIKLCQQKMELINTEGSKIKEKLLAMGKEQDGFSKELSEINAKFKLETQELKAKGQQQRSFYKEYQSLYSKRENLKDSIVKSENVMIRFEEKIRAVEQRANDIKVRRAELLGELEGLKKEFEEYEGVSLRKGLKIEDLNAEIRNHEQKMKSMGSINLRALDIYEKAKAEYDNLLEKFERLKVEKESVLGMMYEIESNKKDVFMKSYRNLNKFFKEIFLTLSTKGEATLVLENEEDPFEAGVGIAVRIAQNKYLDIKSLSGGEKTMAALAFIFAIQEFEPAHFYLLDEVDAALDKRNSELLSKLVNKYAVRAQYLVISHNDAVITEADTIYGVSMQDGISKVVCLKI
ncbi:MAG: LAGLIDADG family homing endonuclease [Candidatus Woesearchaeota archaeon]